MAVERLKMQQIKRWKRTISEIVAIRVKLSVIFFHLGDIISYDPCEKGTSHGGRHEEKESWFSMKGALGWDRSTRTNQGANMLSHIISELLCHLFDVISTSFVLVRVCTVGHRWFKFGWFLPVSDIPQVSKYYYPSQKCTVEKRVYIHFFHLRDAIATMSATARSDLEQFREDLLLEQALRESEADAAEEPLVPTSAEEEHHVPECTNVERRMRLIDDEGDDDVVIFDVESSERSFDLKHVTTSTKIDIAAEENEKHEDEAADEYNVLRLQNLEECPLLLIPTDTLFEVLMHLPPIYLLRLKMTCSTLRKLCASDILWSPLYHISRYSIRPHVLGVTPQVRSRSFDSLFTPSDHKVRVSGERCCGPRSLSCYYF